MAGTTLDFPEDVKKFVADAMNNKTGKIPLNPGFVDDKYGRSEFFQLRRACATTTVGVVPSNLDAGKVCNLVLVKATEEARKGTPITDPKHLLALHAFIMEDKGYTKGPDSGRKLEDAAAFGAALYAQHAKGNDSKEPRIPFAIDDKRFLPAGATKPVGFTNFKGMALDAAFTDNLNYFLERGYDNPSATGLSGSAVPDYKLAEISSSCRVGSKDVTYSDCRSAGYQLSKIVAGPIR